MKLKTITIELTTHEVVLLNLLIGNLTGEQYAKAGLSQNERDTLLQVRAQMPVIPPQPKAS